MSNPTTFRTTAYLTALLIGTSLNTTRAEVELGKGLTADGFIDMSATATDSDADGSSSTASFDQFEIVFHFDAEDGIKARVDLDYQPADEGTETEIEQAIISHEFAGGTTLGAGRFLTPHGYEAAEPTGLWQYSVSATIIGYAGYANGIFAQQSLGDLGSVYVSVVDGSYSRDQDADDVSVEAQVKLTPAEGLTLQAAFASEKFGSVDGIGIEGEDDFAPGVGSYDQGIANFWAEYAFGGFTVAAEYNQLFEIGGPDGDGDGYLVMCNYSQGKAGITFRHSGVELDDGYENTEFTISPNYTFTDSLFGLLEFRTDDFGDDGDATSFAAEMIYTF